MSVEERVMSLVTEMSNLTETDQSSNESEIVFRVGGGRFVPRLQRVEPVVAGPVQLHMTERGSLENLSVRGQSAARWWPAGGGVSGPRGAVHGGARGDS